MSQILIPSLRFSDFNEEWKSKRYSEIFTTFKSGQTITSSQISELGDFPVYGGNGLRGYTDSFTHDGYYFLIGRQGALCGNINRVQGRIYISEHAIACQVEDELATEFYAQRLEQMNLNRFSESSAQPGLSVSKLLRFKLYIPTLSEQQKIASFLTSIDNKISQLTEKHRLLKEYKKGVIQQIFSQQLRFKDEDGKAFPEWEGMNLDDVLLLQSDSLKMKDNESYELITVKRRFGGITSRGNYLGKDVLVKNQFTIHEDEFVISKRQIVHGACGLVPKELEGAIVSNEYNVFRPVADKLDLDYFNRFSTTPYMRRSYFINSDGVHIEKLLFKTQSWLKTKVDLPCLKEQQKIAQFLQSIDKKVDLVAQQVEETKQFKKGLLQQMFV